MYEMSRVERLRPTDLMQIEDTFVSYLFELIEGGTEDLNDLHHYSAIKILVRKPFPSTCASPLLL